MTAWGEWGLAEDVAKCAVFLANDDAAYVTGLPMALGGGYTAHWYGKESCTANPCWS